MEYKTNSIASRIEWCRRQKTQARTQLEREGWQAEVEGSATRSSIEEFTRTRHCPPGVFKRYVIGFQDGQALIRVTRCTGCMPHPQPIGHMFDPGSLWESHGDRAAMLALLP